MGVDHRHLFPFSEDTNLTSAYVFGGFFADETNDRKVELVTAVFFDTQDAWYWRHVGIVKTENVSKMEDDTIEILHTAFSGFSSVGK